MTTAKAWVAFLFAVISSVNAAFTDDILNIGDAEQVIVSVVIAIGALIAVYQTPNAKPKDKNSQ